MLVSKRSIGIISALILGMILSIFTSQVDLRPQQVLAQSCSLPGQVQGVLVEYPKCTGEVCDFTMASCTWNTVSGATSYNVSVTQVETGGSALSQTVDAATTRVEFNVVQNNTYRCDVAAVNSCGSGLVGTHSLLCEVDALIEQSPTPIPPTSAPKPTIPPTGGVSSLPLLAGTGAVLLSGAGIYFFRRK